jgi:outer membrane murein-binding lipoprotein Lpp
MVKKNIMLFLLILFGLVFTGCADNKNVDADDLSNQVKSPNENQDNVNVNSEQTSENSENEVLDETFSEAEQVDSEVEIGELI